MNKIGILTFHRSINYGSVLQAWALEQFLLDCGYNVEIINYKPKEYEAIYGLFDKGKSKIIVKENIKRLLYLDLFIYQMRTFQKFRNKYLKQSDKEYFYDSDFEKLGERYNCIICGSDQIWNVRARDCDPIYFLPTSHTYKKIAYAVSINSMDFTEQYDFEKIKQWIKDFDYISVRENSGADKLSHFLHQKIQTAMDPTLLFDKKKYDCICSDRIIDSKYIFMYSVTYNDDVITKAVELGKKSGLPVYTISITRSASILLKLNRKGIKVLRWRSSPSDFLSCIKYADFVVTDSFHGTAFSVNYEKNFIAVNDRTSQGYVNDERIVSLLNMLGLEKRYISGGDELKNVRNIDYLQVSPQKDKMINESKNKLCQILEDHK